MGAYFYWLAARYQDLPLTLLLIPCICSVVLAVAATLVFWSKKKHSVRMPPAPPALPIIGHLHLLGALPHRTLARMSKTYGPLLSLRLGSVPVLVASTPDIAMQILRTHDNIFCSRPQHLSVTKHLLYGSPNILFSPPGPFLKLVRQMCATKFFSNKRFEHFRPTRSQEVRSLILSVLESEHKPVCIREKLQMFTSNVIAQMVLGKRLEEMDTANARNSHNIVSVLQDMLPLLGVLNLGDYIPFLACMDLQGYTRQTKEVARRARSVFQGIIDKRRETFHDTNEASGDFLDVLLMASQVQTEIPFDDSNIRAILMDMFAAGTDTSVVTTEWALAELLANPKTLRILQEELNDKVGTSRLVEERDLTNLPYLEVVVMETLRLHPVSPLLAPHMSMKPCHISGYHIPANTLAYVNVWAIQTDPNFWDNPLEFHPERFLDSHIDLLGQNLKYLPFGSGRRACPGWKLGFLNVQNALANLIHAFDWTTLGKPQMDEKLGIVMTLKDPLIVVPTPRLPLAFFKALK